MLPKKACDVNRCEVARIMKLTSKGDVEPLPFYVSSLFIIIIINRFLVSLKVISLICILLHMLVFLLFPMKNGEKDRIVILYLWYVYIDRSDD